MALDTALDILNAACAVIGAEPLQSLSDEISGAQSAGLVYETVTDFNLALEPFAFAHEFRQCSRRAAAAAGSGFLYVYDVPGPVLGLPRFLTDDPSDPDARFNRYILVGGSVHCDAEDLWANVKFRPEPNRWAPAFKAATIHALAASLSLSLASDRNGYEQLKATAYGTPSEAFRGGMMRAAINENAQATPPRRAHWDNNPLTRAWRGGDA